MTRVDFYILSDASSDAAEHFACRLTEKAFHGQHRIALRTATRDAATRLDATLWTFRQGSFIPHRLADEPDNPVLPAPVIVGAQDSAMEPRDLCINLSGSIPPNSGQWQRIAEIVPGTDADKVAARDRFRQYRDLGCEMHTHNVTA